MSQQTWKNKNKTVIVTSLRKYCGVLVTNIDDKCLFLKAGNNPDVLQWLYD